MASALKVTPQYVALLAKGERPLTIEKQAALAVFLRSEAKKMQLSADAAIVLAKVIEQGLRYATGADSAELPAGLGTALLRPIDPDFSSTPGHAHLRTHARNRQLDPKSQNQQNQRVMRNPAAYTPLPPFVTRPARWAIRRSDVFAAQMRRPMELYQFDLRVMARGCGQTSVARQQRCVERLGQRDIGGVIGGQIVA